MKEEIKEIHPAALENAKFYLKQYAEHVADQIRLMRENLEHDKRVFTSRGGVLDKYGVVVSNRIEERGSRLELKELQLKGIEITINAL